MVLVVKNPPANVRDAGLIPGSGRCPGGGHGNPLQYSCLENAMDRGAWQAAAHRVSMRQTQLSTQTHPEYTGLTHHDFSQESSPQNRETRKGMLPQNDALIT